MAEGYHPPLSPLAESALSRMTPTEATRFLKDLQPRVKEADTEKPSGFITQSMDDLRGRDRE